MRINRFIASATGCSRRTADKLIASGKVIVNGQPATLGLVVTETDKVFCDGQRLSLPRLSASAPQLILLNKPIGYVCSRAGQESKTVYELLPPELHHLKLVGRLDKDSSGLLLLTNDGKLAHELMHPKFGKEKVYEVELDKPLTSEDKAKIEHGVKIENYTSRFRLSEIGDCSWRIVMSQGRNRQIRRTFIALGYNVTKLHRIQFGNYKLGGLKNAKFLEVTTVDPEQVRVG